MAAPLVVPALTRHTATVIMAHGLGDSGAGWIMLAHNFRRRGLFNEVAFIFPNAPAIPITINFGMSMPGWYDIVKLGVNVPVEEFSKAQDERGILKSRDYFNSLIKAEMDKGISPSRIVLGGFSQGGAMSLFTGITQKEKLGGIFGLSCYLPLGEKISTFMPDGFPNKQTPVFMAHGDADSTVLFEWGQRSADSLKALGMSVDFNKYAGMGHSADPGEMADLEKFLHRVIQQRMQRQTH
ncbi:acyl-protein thioesterase 1 [Blastomyces gilchristii SLH14081]|uniref:Acyl-protein thioesterase 1 n=1 Tax=Blastomyces gilchristii (strain SLH14081) TaxID=559298 RepID=A0A179UZ59_BLAGS|nr:acyl-protein thioesterase 1 [Blastomyces gilchristii SLH14081]OAT13374.1 acyl-protein thioesterase 1 [Blastomyces gilchristii SLH14081]